MKRERERIVVLGAHGQLGFELMRATCPDDRSVVGFGRDDVDITDAGAVRRVLRAARPDVVINAAAYTAVDRAESERELAFAVNRDGAGNVAKACADHGALVVHISTDYVFSGQKKRPYVEDDTPDPINVYGASKAAGEDEVRRATTRHAVLRTSWVYGAHGSNFVKTMLRLGRSRTSLRVVADQHGSPTAAADLARAALEIASSRGRPEIFGTYHFSGSGVTTWYEFAKAVFDVSSLDPKPTVEPVTTLDYGSPALRPLNAVLEGSKFAKTFGQTARPWLESLREVVAELEHDSGSHS